jgi:hypothetical protein
MENEPSRDLRVIDWEAVASGSQLVTEEELDLLVRATPGESEES